MCRWTRLERRRRQMKVLGAWQTTQPWQRRVVGGARSRARVRKRLEDR